MQKMRIGKSVGKTNKILRGVFSVVLSAALVLSDALPVNSPMGLSEMTEAAGPSKGYITFYEYRLITNFDELNPKDDNYRDTLMMYECNGNWYAPNSKILATDNWPVGKVADMIPHFKFDAPFFYSRTLSYQRRLCSPNWSVYYNPLFFDTVSPDGSTAGLAANNDGNIIYPSSGSMFPFEVSGQSSVSHDWGTEYKVNIRNYYRKNGERTGGPYVTGNESKMWGSGGGPVAFRMYNVNTYYYTCITRDYTIGQNQVYTADRDLILKEGATLTIPEGSVLCVKKGPFYVNGEIKCRGTILVEDGGIIMPIESTGAGSRIILEEGGAMIIRSGGRVYAGCPKDSLWTQGDSGWLDMYAGSSIINFGLLVAGKCNFTYGQATIENHKGARMYLGYTVSNDGEHSFMCTRWPGEGAGTGTEGTLVLNPTESSFGLVKTNGTVHYGKGDNITVFKTWDGAAISFANKDGSGGQSIKLYSYDKDGKCTVYSSYSP